MVMLKKRQGLTEQRRKIHALQTVRSRYQKYADGASKNVTYYLAAVQEITARIEAQKELLEAMLCEKTERTSL